MKDEQKAMEIIGKGCQRENCLECGGSLSVENGCVQFRKLMEMAEWKQKEMIEKACKWLEENATYTHPRTGTESCMINLAMFKQAMMEE